MRLVDKTNAAALVSGSLSLISSSLIITFVPRSNGGLSTPYRRIIFGLSFSDVIQSLANILGPFFLPRTSTRTEVTSGSSWAFGNVHTCDLQGFMLTLGACATCMYTLFLCLYYYCKLKRHMSDQTFHKKIEKKIHWFIVVVNMVVCSVALATKTFNPVPGAGTCQLTRKPFWCDPRVTGSCERGHFANLFTLYYFPVAVPCICLLGTLIFMVLITVHVTIQARRFRNQTVQNAKSEDTEAEYVARLLRRETALQVIFYGLAFVLTYGWIFPLSVLLRANIRPPIFVAVIVGVSFPLVGVFNILIYTRPQVVAYRRLHSEVSWPVAFWLVIKAGGENPEAVAVSTSPSLPYGSAPTCCCCSLLCCLKFKSLKNEENQNLFFAHQRLQRLRRVRYSSQPVMRDPKQVDETLYPEVYPMEFNAQVDPIDIDPESGECLRKEYSVKVGNDNSLKEGRMDLSERTDDGTDANAFTDSYMSSTQKEAIFRAFEKATVRANTSGLVRGGVKENVDSSSSLSHVFEDPHRNNSQWSNGVSIGSSLGGSVIDVLDMINSNDKS